MKVDEAFIYVADVKPKSVILLIAHLLRLYFLISGEDIEERLAAKLIPVVFAGNDFDISNVVLRCC